MKFLDTPEFLLHRLHREMERVADRLLVEHLNMSYKRGHFLAVLQRCGTVTQHQLAVKLGNSDPAISNMLLELSKAGYVNIKIDPAHARKRLVSITAEGDEIATKGQAILNGHFKQILAKAKVNGSQYADLTNRIYHALLCSDKDPGNINR